MSIFDNFNNRFGQLGMPANLGLLTTGIGFLEGQNPLQAIQAGIGTYGSFQEMEEDRRRKAALTKLLSDGGFTDQEKGIISASNNPASVAAQIRNDKLAFQRQQSQPLSNIAKLKSDLDNNRITQQEYDDRLNVLNYIKPVGNTAVSPIGKLSEDLKNGKITQDEYNAAFKKATQTSSTNVTDQRTLLADTYKLTGDDRKTYILTGRLPTPPSDRGRYQEKGAYKIGDDIIGSVSFDTMTNELFYEKDGKKEILDPLTAIPVNDSYFNLGIPNTSNFKKLRNEVRDDQTSLKRYTSYLNNIQNSEVGFARLADQMTGAIKTLLSRKGKMAKLSEEELALKLAQGELQGLIGRSRIETVGGGVMTEQDALRIITNLGGDVNLLQNPEVVRGQISRLFTDKFTSYKDKIQEYNIAVGAKYGELGYEPLEPIEIDPNLLDQRARQELGFEEPTTPSSNLFPEDLSQLSSLSDEAISNILVEMPVEQMTAEQQKALLEELERRK